MPCQGTKDNKEAAEPKLEGGLTKVHAVLIITLQKAQQQLPQVARRLPGDARIENKSKVREACSLLKLLLHIQEGNLQMQTPFVPAGLGTYQELRLNRNISICISV